MMRKRAPWAIAALLAVALVCVLVNQWRMRAPAEDSSSVSRGDNVRGVSKRTPSSATPPQLTLLRRCTARLRATHAMLDTYRRLSHSTDTTDSSRLTQCRRLPGFDALLRSAVGDLLQAPTTGEPAAPRPGVRRTTAALRLLEQQLQLTPDEASWVSDYVCQVRQLRQQAIRDLGDPERDLESDLAAMEADRRAVLQDLRDYLGKPHYEHLRQIGGLGLLGDALDCAQ